MSEGTVLKWMSGPEAAEMLGVSPQTVRRRAAEMGIKYRPWGQYRFNRADVERVAREQTEQTTASA